MSESTSASLTPATTHTSGLSSTTTYAPTNNFSNAPLPFPFSSYIPYNYPPPFIHPHLPPNPQFVHPQRYGQSQMNYRLQSASPLAPNQQPPVQPQFSNPPPPSNLIRFQPKNEKFTVPHSHHSKPSHSNDDSQAYYTFHREPLYSQFSRMNTQPVPEWPTQVQQLWRDSPTSSNPPPEANRKGISLISPQPKAVIRISDVFKNEPEEDIKDNAFFSESLMLNPKSPITELG
jgi:hypothetical protein